jgi:hypothetical protein
MTAVFGGKSIIDERLGNLLARSAPSLQRSYTIGILVNPPSSHPAPHVEYPSHPKIRQSEFYNTTPGHNRYLINHWIVRDRNTAGYTSNSREAVFTANLSPGRITGARSAEDRGPVAG